MRNYFFRLILIFSLYGINQGYSQALNQFHHLYGTSSSDDPSSILQLGNGDNVISGTISNGTIGGSDIYVIRVDSLGTIVWQNLYGGFRNDAAAFSLINNNGNILITGTSASYNNGRNLDLFLFEIDLDGNIRWSRTFGNASLDEIPKSISLTSTGIVLCGTIGSAGTASPDILVFEINNNGSRLNWQNIIAVAGAYGDIPSAIISSSLGGYIMVGGSHNPVAGYDQLVWRLNASGQLQSNIAFGSNNNENAQSLIELPNSDIVVMGNFRTLSGTGLELSLASIKSNNTFNWIKTYGDNGSKDERAFGFIQASTKGYGFCGYTNGLGAGGNDILFVKTDDRGRLLSSSSYGDTGNETSIGLIQNSNNGFTILGSSNSAGSGGNDTYLIRTDTNGHAVNSCSSYNIIQRTITLSTHSYIYNESNPSLSNNSVSISKRTSLFNNINFSCSTLPLELIDFSVVSNGNFNNIIWTTLNEYNLTHFEIEKTYDGIDWEIAIVIKSEGETNKQRKYAFDDFIKSKECVYYRLKEVDQNGYHTYSKIIKNCSTPNFDLIYPNPTNRFINFVGVYLNENSSASISLSDINGDEIFKKIITNDDIVDNAFELDLINVKPGIYCMNFNSINQFLIRRIIRN